MIRIIVAAVAALVISTSALAEGVKGKQVAPNGVVIDTFIDDFAGRAEYTTPSVDFKLPGQAYNSTAFVARIKKGGSWGPTQLVVLVFYRGDWRFYGTAVFKGGEPAEFREASRNVVSCAGSRYGGCSHSESMYITVTPEQLAKYAENGSLQIQIGARSATGSVITVPASHFEAIHSLSSTAAASSLPPQAPAAATAPPKAVAVAPKKQPAVKCDTCRTDQ